MPDKHAIYGPSSLKHREICAGWRNDPSADLTRANEGTKLHDAAETGNLRGLDKEQLEAVKKCLNYIRPFETGADQVHKELRLVIMDGLTFGTADRVVIRGRHAHLIDFKFGYGFIDDAEENRQGIAYTIGVFETFDVDEVTVHFIIPRRDELTKHTFVRDDLPRLRTLIRNIIKRCEAFDASINEKTGECDESLLNANDEACQYCGFIARCPKHRRHAELVAVKYAPIEVVEEAHSSQITDPEQMSRAFTLARIMEKWAESVKKHALDFAKQGFELPGYALRDRAGTRQISNPVLAYQVLLDAGLEPIEVVSASSMSLSKLEEIVSSKAERGQKGKSIAALHQALACNDCLTQGEGTQYLRKVSARG